MLMNCKPGCAGKKATTTASLDVETNDVICDFCGETIEVSSYTKNSMRQRGDIIRRDNRKPFQFECITCKKIVPTELNKNKEVVGVGCQKDCEFNVSKFTVQAMQTLSQRPKEEDIDE